jgi:hypothetical protein
MIPDPIWVKRRLSIGTHLPSDLSPEFEELDKGMPQCVYADTSVVCVVLEHQQKVVKELFLGW